MRLLSTTQSTKDVKRAKRRGKDPDKLWAIVDTLLLGGDLASRHRPHQLSGRWSSHWECHIEPESTATTRAPRGQVRPAPAQ